MTKAKSTDVGAARSRGSDEVQTLAEVFVAPPNSCFFVWRPLLENATLAGEGITGSRKIAPDLPSLTLYCEECEGERSFSGYWIAADPARYDKGPAKGETQQHRVAVYTCRNCGAHTVGMYLRIAVPKASDGRESYLRVVSKAGQAPPYRPKIPRRVQRFVQGNDWHLYQKGVLAESLGLGIAAFTYYRRIVEDVWSRLLDKLILVAKETKDPQALTELETSRSNWRFNGAVQDVQPAVPRRVLIGSANPLTLLHNAFSAGVHNLSDEDCLDRARDGRRVLESLLESISQTLDDRSELLASVARLSTPPKANDAPATQNEPVVSGSKGPGEKN